MKFNFAKAPYGSVIIKRESGVNDINYNSIYKKV